MLNIIDLGFSTTSFVFTRMQVLVWVSNGTSLLSLIEKNAGHLLSRMLLEFEPDKPLVVSFKDIVNIDDHALDDVFNCLSSNNRQLIILDGFHLVELMHKLKKDSKANIETDSAFNIIKIGKRVKINFQDIVNERKQIKVNFLKNTIQGTFRKFENEKRLSSTPIITNGEFDSNRILSNPKYFIWTTAFLSDALRDLLDRTQLKKVKLLSASLRGAPFASMLGMLHNLEYETIDHFGPKHKVFEFDFIKKIEKGTSYIYVGDFCFAGTEIKIAKTYTEMKSSRLEHALVIGNLIESEVFKDDFELISLINLNELGTGVTYKLL
ncbi:MAG: hypothetical protein LCH54_17375 [Bacteroidetes bacterium]|nr:hypothetical protein [Bacteroidota bacterium]